MPPLQSNQTPAWLLPPSPISTSSFLPANPHRCPHHLHYPTIPTIPASATLHRRLRRLRRRTRTTLTTQPTTHSTRLLTTTTTTTSPSPYSQPRNTNTPQNAPDVSLAFQTVPHSPQPIPLSVTGIIPHYLSNLTYYRNGPGLFEVDHADGQKWTADHWFDGLATVHAFSIDKHASSITYRSRMVSESVYNTIKNLRKRDYIAVSFSRQALEHRSLLQRLNLLRPFSTDPHTGNIPYNVNVTLQAIPGKGNLNARTDANIAHRLDPTTLQTTETYTFQDFNDALNSVCSCSHGMLDHKTGQFYNFVQEYGVNKVDYKVYCIDKNGHTKVIATFKDYSYYLHSFSLTENYVILALWPCEVDLLKFLATKSHTDSCQLRPNTPTKFVLVSRKHDKVAAVYEHDQFFCFHTINAFEKNDSIYLDLTYYRDLQVMKDLRLDNITASGKMAKGVPTRFTLPDVSKAVAAGPSVPYKATSKPLADIHFEFGVVAPAREHAEYRYTYGVSDRDRKSFMADISKIDTWTGRVQTWSAPATFTGEPRFIPDPNGTREDDGSLVILTLDTESKNSALVILDASTMKEVARAVVPSMIPLGFHGSCYPTE